MKVKLISHSAAPHVISENDPTLGNVQGLIAFCARVSNPSNQMNSETSHKLLKYLMKHKHWSPFEMVNVCLEIETTRDIGRQILRHRSFSFQEFSQRYADPVKELELLPREARFQDPKNRQNSIDLDPDNEEHRTLNEQFRIKQQELINQSKALYNWAVENGIAKEQARAVLPEGNTVSRMYMNGTLRSWIHYIDLRSANGTQKEHIEIAKQCGKVIADVFPMAIEYVNHDSLEETL